MMRERRKFRIECPDSMKGNIDTSAAHDLISPADREHLRTRYQMPDDVEFNAVLDRAGEWIERFLRSDEHKPLPPSHTQVQSRKALLGPAEKLVAAMKKSDGETQKRLYHYLADHPLKGAPVRDEGEKDFDYGHRMYRRLRRNLKVLSEAIVDSKRDDDSKGQAAPSTYLLYQLTLIWIDLTGYTISTDPKTFPQRKVLRFCDELLKAARHSSPKSDTRILTSLLSKSPKSALTAISRKLARRDPERDPRSKEKRDRSDNDTEHERRAGS